MANNDIKQHIKQSIQACSSGNLTQKALNLFTALGYNTERQAQLDKPTVAIFKDSYIDRQSKFNEEKALTKDWKYVDLLFQLSKEEVQKTASLFDTKQVDRTVIETYLFFVIDLVKDHYTRTELSLVTREVNRIFPMPVMILFKHGQLLTLSVIDRRLHKRDESKDVLEKVTLIKDIQLENPHRAHIEILFDLSFDELQRNIGFTNFVELHNAWKKTLDTKELNKRFFQELANWYFWALQNVEFPEDAEKNKDVRNAISVIRMITRLIFIWFVKEKGLIPDELFNQTKLKSLLNLTDKNQSTYYKAILQNLFFATLNTEMNKDKPGSRKFRGKNKSDGRDQHYMIHNVFRYEDYFTSPQDTLKKYFENVPFLNGGLFECLDKILASNGKDKVVRIDGFSDHSKNGLKVPDYLFFSSEQPVDLNEIYGTKNKNYQVRGLIDILDSYKFTVDENTPIEEEIALDPELLGKVFENLLASYNPETQTTARKQTGSFYTPREIVNYMVDESIIAYLSTKLIAKNPAYGNDERLLDERLRHLVAYNDLHHEFTPAEVDVLIEAINELKAIDPACGSGAFPMGMLHKLVYILGKLDPDNSKWRELQKGKAIRETEKAYKIGDREEREKRLLDISEVFENNASDYGRKLYLIENCIFGVDIQPIAVQIAKLRFFISLIVDQLIDPQKGNLGIRPLPNLETKFVTANTLIGIEKPKQQLSLFDNKKVKELEDKLKDVRHRIFSAKTPTTKRKLREEDQKLREEIADMLIKNGWGNKSAHQLAAWDPYNQNASSPFFDVEWMFGVTDGFDVVIGNPPYKILTKNNTESVQLEYLLARYISIQGSYSKNLFTLFIENAFAILTTNATLSFIVPEGLFKTRSYSGCVDEIEKNGYIKSIVTFTEYVFENAVTGNLIFVFSKNSKGITRKYHFSESFELVTVKANENSTLPKIVSDTKPLSEVAVTFKGMVVKDRDLVLSNKKAGKKNIFLLGKNISKWVIESKYYANYEELEIVGGTKKIEKHNHSPRILIRRTGNTLCCAFLTEKALTESTLYSCWSISNRIKDKVLLGLLNSKLLNYYNQELFITNQQGFPQILMTDLELLPIKIPSNHFQEGFSSIVDIVLQARNPFFEFLLDALVYELYFPSEIKAAGAEILKHLTDPPKLKDDWDDEKKLKVIAKVYKELSDPKHPVSVAMEKQKTVPEVRIIERLDK